MAPNEERTPPPSPVVGLHPRYTGKVSSTSLIRKHAPPQARREQDAPAPPTSTPRE